MEVRTQREQPRRVTSRRSIKYRESGWRVHEFEMWSGEMVCRCAALHMEGSLLVWVGGAGGAAARLAEAALAVPGAGVAALLGGEADAAAPQLARRLAAALARPVYVCCGSAFDRFTMPLVERALLAEIRREPKHF